MNKLNFQIICVDTDNKVKVKNEQNFLYLLLSNSELWENCELKDKTIIEKDKSLSCTVNIISNKENNIPQISFTIQISGNYNKLEPFRLKILEFIKNQNFKHIYVIKDDISRNIAHELYPLINMIENNLRAYLMKFFITKLGVGWWDSTADNDMKNKAQKRKNNEKEFSKYIDNKVYLIDFGELGKMIYLLSTGFLTKSDIINKIQKTTTIEELNNLKNELQSNYNKFFKKSFKDKDFQKKWESVEQIRHKVAHNNLFTNNDLVKAKKECKELLKIIEDADKAIINFNFTEEEKEKMVLDYSSSPTYSEFIENWKDFIEILKKLSNKNNYTKKYENHINPTLISTFLLDKKLIKNTAYEKIENLIQFRNKLVHNPNNEFIENELEEKIEDLKYIINLLSALNRLN